MVKVYVASFPLKPSGTIEDLARVTSEWIEDSPHNTLNRGDLKGSYEDGFLYDRDDLRIETVGLMHGGEDFGKRYWALRFTQNKGLEHWVSDVVAVKSPNSLWFLTQVDYKTSRRGRRRTGNKKPLIVDRVLTKIGGGVDGKYLSVANTEHLVDERDAEILAEILANKTKNELPVVYLSVGQNGEPAVNARILAMKLSGMAHVIREKDNLSFKIIRELRKLGSDVKPPYKGYIAIYWPDRTISHIRPEDKRQGIHSIYKMLVRYSLGFQPIEDFDGVKRKKVSIEIDNLRKKKTELEARVSETDNLFDKEELERRIREAEEEAMNLAVGEIEERNSEIERLRERIRGLELKLQITNARKGSGTKGRTELIVVPETPELYAGELRDLIVEAINYYKRRGTPADSRREGIIHELCKLNEPTGMKTTILAELEKIFSGNPRNLCAPHILQTFESLGFLVERNGGHFKLRIPGTQYFVTMPTTPGENRSGRNILKTIIRELL